MHPMQRPLGNPDEAYEAACEEAGAAGAAHVEASEAAHSARTELHAVMVERVRRFQALLEFVQENIDDTYKVRLWK